LNKTNTQRPVQMSRMLALVRYRYQTHQIKRQLRITK